MSLRDMGEADLKRRTQDFALAVIRFVRVLPTSTEMRVMGKQLLRCATSVGANYRSALRAKSPQDFLAKLKIVEEEADESVYWLELISRCGEPGRAAQLLDEGAQLTAIFSASVIRAKATCRPS